MGKAVSLIIAAMPHVVRGH